MRDLETQELDEEGVVGMDCEGQLLELRHVVIQPVQTGQVCPAELPPSSPYPVTSWNCRSH